MSKLLDDAFAAPVPLFPLPGVVLFPGAVLPLHIFEERYKQMTADALHGNRRIAMALLRPGWEKSYHARPTIEPVVCVGTILTHERLANGKYNFLLQGRTRARVVREVSAAEHPYRVAELRPLETIPAMEIDLSRQRQRLHDAFSENSLGSTPLGQQFLKLIRSSVGTGELADLIAFNFVEDVDLKQQLLSDVDVVRRVDRTIEAFLADHGAAQPVFSQALGQPSVN